MEAEQIQKNLKSNSKNTRQGTKNEQTTQNEKINMWFNFLDQNRTNQWSMHPFYINLFNSTLELIKLLRTMIRQKWRPFQRKEYLRYLNDLESYINQNIWTGIVSNYNTFMNVLKYYRKNTNSEGEKLYNQQFLYLCKSEGLFDVKQQKKSQPYKAGKQQWRKTNKNARLKKDIMNKQKQFTQKVIHFSVFEIDNWKICNFYLNKLISSNNLKCIVLVLQSSQLQDQNQIKLNEIKSSLINQ